MKMRDLVPWSRPGDIVTLRREMDSLFDRFFDWRPFGGGTEVSVWSPALDVSETPKEVLVRAELSGMDPKEIEINLHDNVLTVRGERKQEKEDKEENYHRVERSYGSFVRSLRLPAEVESDNVDATYKDGILMIKLKKSEKIAQRKIEIKAG
ncbi:Hsp20/alpha crystallin family protein [delta proteobacterium NaphS2]|nr:Hsp20/alpha crystallin family protein [delta proteobacterium NaphS2]